MRAPFSPPKFLCAAALVPCLCMAAPAGASVRPSPAVSSLLPAQVAHAKAAKGHKHGGGGASGHANAPPNDIQPEVMARLRRDNPGLADNFLEKSPPEREITLSDGQKYPLYRLTQFLHHNFRMELKAAEKEGEGLIAAQNWKMHRLMALPEFRDWFKSYGKTYKVHGRKVGWEAAYDFVRRLHNTVRVAVSPKARMPYGGGGRAVAPSWAVWKKLNLLYHEAANATPGFSGDDPVLTGVLAGKLQKMTRKKLWNYPTIDVNTLRVTDGHPPSGKSGG